MVSSDSLLVCLQISIKQVRMKSFFLIATVIVLSSGNVIPKSDIATELDRFFAQSLIEGNASFMTYFNAMDDYIDPKARSLRASYEAFKPSVARFPFDRLTPETRELFGNIIRSVEYFLEAGVKMAEFHSLNFIWPVDPVTGLRDVNTPTEDYLNSYLRTDINNMKLYIEMSHEDCGAPLIPLLIDHYQGYVDIVNAAAIDRIPTIDSHFQLIHTTDQLTQSWYQMKPQ